MRIATTLLLATMIAFSCAFIYLLYKVIKANENGDLFAKNPWAVSKLNPKHIKNGMRIYNIVRLLGFILVLEFITILIILFLD